MLLVKKISVKIRGDILLEGYILLLIKNKVNNKIKIVIKLLKTVLNKIKGSFILGL